MNHIFTVTVTYFKPSGKCYIQETVTLLLENVGTKSHPTCDMDEVVTWIKHHRERGSLPGLHNGIWDGPILVTCEEGYPCLITGEE